MGLCSPFSHAWEPSHSVIHFFELTLLVHLKNIVVATMNSIFLTFILSYFLTFLQEDVDLGFWSFPNGPISHKKIRFMAKKDSELLAHWGERISVCNLIFWFFLLFNFCVLIRNTCKISSKGCRHRLVIRALYCESLRHTFKHLYFIPISSNETFILIA